MLPSPSPRHLGAGSSGFTLLLSACPAPSMSMIRKLVFETGVSTYHVMTSQQGEGVMVYIQEMPVNPDSAKGLKVMELIDKGVPLLTIAANLAEFTFFVCKGGSLLVIRGDEDRAGEVFEELSVPIIEWLRIEIEQTVRADCIPEA